MKIVNKALVILTAVLALTAVSCDNLITETNKTPGTYLVATVEDFVNNSARTVLPDVELNSFTNFKITGSKNGGENQNLANFGSYTEMESSMIPISAGIWNLNLKASSGDTVFESTLNDTEIVSGRNTVSFDLTMSSFGNYSSPDDGGIMFTLNLPENSDAQKALISLESYSGVSTGSEFVNYEALVENNQVVYAANDINPGYYRLKIELYGDEECLLYLNTYREIVVVASNLTSTALRSMNVTEKVYSITYENIDSENVLSNYTLTETVTRHSAAVQLPTLENLSKNGCTFLGWYTTEDFQTGSEITFISNLTKDLTVYAKWERNYYTITYVNGGDNNSNPTQYQFGDSFDFVDPVVPVGNNFLGWYTTEDFQEGTEITGIESTLFEDITIYGKYNYTIYTITYVTYQEGVVVDTPESENPVEYKFTDNITFAIPENTGYILRGFFSSTDFTDDANRIEGIPVGSNGNKTVYLQYITNRISVSDLSASLAQLGTNSVYDLIITDTDLDFAEIKTALDEHKDVKVTLDLSAATNVTEIPNNALQTASNIVGITLPDTVTTINSYAFAGTTALETVVLGSGVTTISSRAFQGAVGLKEIVVPGSVTTIGDYAFAGTKGLEITIPDTVTSFGDYVFYGSNEDVITIPSNYVFSKAPASENGVNNMLRMSSGDKVIFSDSPSSVVDYAFAGANGIKVTIPSSVTTIGEKVFSKVAGAEIAVYYNTFANTLSSSGSALFTGATDFEFAFADADSVTTIPNYAFYNSDVAKITIPESVTAIGEKAFAGTKLTSVSLPDGLESISSEAFADMKDLEITIPLSVTYVDSSIFKNDENLKLDIDVKLINYYKPYSAGTSYYNSLLKDIASVEINLLESETTYIDSYAFNNTPNVTSVTIPYTIKSINSYAFYYATGLSEITIPNTVTSIGNYTFWYAGKALPDGWTITLPLKLLNSTARSSYSYGNYLFNQDSSCRTNAFNLILTNPEDEQNANYTNYVNDYALTQATNMKSVVLPENISSIGTHAFQNCYALRDVTIPASVTTMNSYAFQNCSALQTVIYESDTVLPTAYYAFDNAKNITTVKVNSLDVWCNWTNKGFNYSPFFGSRSNSSVSTELYIGNELLTSISLSGDVDTIYSSQYMNVDSISSIDLSGAKSINEYAFAYCDGITEVTIPDTLQAGSGGYIFQNCKNLEIIRFLNETILNSGYNWFTNCTGVESVYIQNIDVWNNWSSFGSAYSPFYGTSVENTKLYVNGSLLKKYTVPGNWTSVPAGLFYKVGCLEKVNIHNNVEYIRSYAFYKCINLENVVLPSALISTEEAAFGSCTKLTQITIPDNVTSIGSYSFVNCTSLSKVIISSNSKLQTVSQYAFRDCSNLTQISLPDSLTSIGQYAFSGCGFSSIAIPSQINSLGNYAFSNAAALKTIVYLNTSVLPTGQYAFSGCKAVEEVYVPSIEVWCNWSTSGVEYSPLYGTEVADTKLYFNGHDAGNVVLPDTLTAVPASLFRKISNITSVTIPSTVTSIRDYAFANCSGLKEVIIPDSVTSMGSYIFMGDTNITRIDIPNSVTSIGNYVFVDCGSNAEDAETLVITMPLKLLNDKIKTSESYTNFLFGGNSYNSSNRYCATYNFELNLTNPTDTEDANYVSSLNAYALCNLVELKAVTLPEGITSIGHRAFLYCRNLINIVIPDSVTSIGEYAFYRCENARSIVIPESVTSLGSFVFVYAGSKTDGAETLAITMPLKLLNDKVCSNTSYTNYLFGGSSYDSGNRYCATYNFTLTLTNPTDTEDPNYAASLNNYALCNLKEMMSVTLPDNITSIGDYAFYYCRGLTSVDIPAAVTSIGDYAFDYCNNLESVEKAGEGTTIGNYAFAVCSKLTSVNISAVTSIGNYAFGECTSLESIDIPDGATTIGEKAFYNCTGLTSITIPNSVTSIGNYAFVNCGSNDDGAATLAITMPLKALNGKVYSNTGCTNFLFGGSSYGGSGNNYCATYNFTLTLTNPTDTEDANYAASLNSYALCNLKEMKSVTLPDNITSIGNFAFYNCRGLTSVNIPDSVTSIGDYAFDYCNNLESVEKAGEATTIGNYAFRYCSKLTSVNISAVTSIGEYAFAYCSVLSSIEIPEGATTIGAYAFYYCSGLTSIIIPNSVTSIENYAFVYCGSNAAGAETLAITMPLKVLNSKVFSNTSYTNYLFGGSLNSSNNYCLTYNFTLTLTNPTDTEDPNYAASLYSYALCNLKEMKSVTLPDNITSIGEYAFYRCYGLTSVNIPDSVTSIGNCAFDYCNNLESVEKAGEATSIGDYAFYYCSGLTSVNISAVTSIGEYAFGDCTSLESINIPEGVTTIGDYAFYDCTALTSIIIPDSVTKLGNYVFNNAGKTMDEGWSITMPLALLNAHANSSSSYCNPLFANGSYNNESNTKLFTLILTNPAENHADSLADYALCHVGKQSYSTYGVKSVVLPDDITSIGYYAFGYCYNLEEVNIPSSVTTIGAYAFCYCRGLTSITIPDSVTSLGNYAFDNAGKTMDEGWSITMPLALLNAHAGTSSSYCNPLFASGTTSSNSSTKLFTLTLTNPAENHADILANYALCRVGNQSYSTYGVKSVVLPDDITSIGTYAFYYDSNLTEITIPTNVTTIGNRAFYYCSGLEELFIPEGVTSIGEYAFYNVPYVHNHSKVDISSMGASNYSSLTDYTELSPSTCITHGSASFKCNKTGCEYNGETAKVVELPLVPHDYVTETENPATCYETGLRHYKCSVCGDESKADETLPMIAHSFDSGVTQSEATCTAKKVVRYTCTVSECGYYEDRVEGSLLSHDYEVTTTPATCSATGNNHYACKNCDYEYDSSISKIAHSLKLITTTDSTCTAEGNEHYECDNCDYEYDVSIPPIAHTIDSDTDNCTVCGAESHSWSKNTDTYEYNFDNNSGNVWSSNNQNQDNTYAFSTWTIDIPETVSSSVLYLIPWSVSSESGYDKLTITVDDVTKVNAVSGTDSGTISLTLSAGTHTVKAGYRKDSSSSSGDDTGKITLDPVYY